MSLTLNMVGGGGGGLKATDALLRVQASANSTVTITKGTTTKTDLGHENADDHTVYDYYFIIHQSQFDSINPWTVSASLSGRTSVDTIIIDTADEYDVFLNYRLPNAYQEVTYIEKEYNQTAWIDTGYTGTRTSDVTILFQMTYYNAAWSWCFGAFKSGNSYFGIQSTADSSVTGNLTFHNSAGNFITNYAVSTSSIYGAKFVNGNQLGKSNNGGSSYTYKSISSTGDPIYSFVLFGVKNGESSAAGLNGATYRIYSVFIDGREYIPCYRKSDSVIGFWDSYSEVFLTPNGGGTLTVGADVT